MSKKQATGSGSSTEAELKGYNYCASIIEWIRNIMKYVYLENIGPSIIECDNKPSCLAIRKACVTPNLLHMNPKHWYCRMLYQRRQIIFAWVSMKYLLADALTKPLSEKTSQLLFKHHFLHEMSKKSGKGDFHRFYESG